MGKRIIYFPYIAWGTSLPIRHCTNKQRHCLSYLQEFSPKYFTLNKKEAFGMDLEPFLNT